MLITIHFNTYFYDLDKSLFTVLFFTNQLTPSFPLFAHVYELVLLLHTQADVLWQTSRSHAFILSHQTYLHIYIQISYATVNRYRYYSKTLNRLRLYNIYDDVCKVYILNL